MELHEFLETFLPDYDKKVSEEMEENFGMCALESFAKKHFPEALANFAKRICEKQRKNCARATAFDHRFANGIINAEQPKIEEV